MFPKKNANYSDRILPDQKKLKKGFNLYLFKKATIKLEMVKKIVTNLTKKETKPRPKIVKKLPQVAAVEDCDCINSPTNYKLKEYAAEHHAQDLFDQLLGTVNEAEKAIKQKVRFFMVEKRKCSENKKTKCDLFESSEQYKEALSELQDYKQVWRKWSGDKRFLKESFAKSLVKFVRGEDNSEIGAACIHLGYYVECTYEAVRAILAKCTKLSQIAFFQRSQIVGSDSLRFLRHRVNPKMILDVLKADQKAVTEAGSFLGVRVECENPITPATWLVNLLFQGPLFQQQMSASWLRVFLHHQKLRRNREEKEKLLELLWLWEYSEMHNIVKSVVEILANDLQENGRLHQQFLKMLSEYKVLPPSMHFPKPKSVLDDNGKVTAEARPVAEMLLYIARRCEWSRKTYLAICFHLGFVREQPPVKFSDIIDDAESSQ